MLDDNAGYFVDGANFDTVIDRYEFDKKLRNILFGAVEIMVAAEAFQPGNLAGLNRQFKGLEKARLDCVCLWVDVFFHLLVRLTFIV